MLDINKLEFKKFPGGELHITDSWVKQINTSVEPLIICRICNSDDLMKLCLFTDAYKRVFGKVFSHLVVPYLPYARQDRVANIGEALSIKVICNIINSLNINKITILDPHSDVCTALLDNVHVVPQWDIFADCIPQGVDIISPDAGALKKIYKLQKCLLQKGINAPIRTATKHRDTQTGTISGTTLDGEPQNTTCVVVDDICDGGGTFLALANILRTQYDKCILMVTHGIFSRGLQELSQYYDRILSTNSFNGQLQNEYNLRVLTVEKLL
jgi:ribose-phosphate pyrophosphokinase